MTTPIDERVRQIVEQIVEEMLEAPPQKVSFDSTFEDLKMDSLAAIEVALAIEEEYKIEIPDEDLNPEKMRSIPDLVAYVKTRVPDRK